MTASDPTLTDFLLARIADREAAATKVGPARGFRAPSGEPHDGKLVVTDTRAMAECEAQRRIVELHEATTKNPAFSTSPPFTPTCALCVSFHGDEECEHERYPCGTLRALGAIYADHPDYRAEWRP